MNWIVIAFLMSVRAENLNFNSVFIAKVKIVIVFGKSENIAVSICVDLFCFVFIVSLRFGSVLQLWDMCVWGVCVCVCVGVCVCVCVYVCAYLLTVFYFILFCDVSLYLCV